MENQANAQNVVWSMFSIKVHHPLYRDWERNTKPNKLAPVYSAETYTFGLTNVK